MASWLNIRHGPRLRVIVQINEQRQRSVGHRQIRNKLRKSSENRETRPESRINR